MGAVKIDTFGGMTPAVDDRLLPDRASAHSENTWLYAGRLSGVPQPTLVRELTADTAKVFRIPNNYSESDNLDESAWMEFTDADTDVVRALVIDDEYDRYYWTSPSHAPKYNTKDRIAGIAENDEYTKVLLHFDGTDASTTISDDNIGGSAHSWSAAGNAQLDTAQKQFGTASLLCDGTGDWTTVADHADFALTSKLFTIDCWVRPAASGTQIYIAGQGATPIAVGTRAWTIGRLSNNHIQAVLGGAATQLVLEGTTSVVSGAWYHIAFVGDGTTAYLFVNGALEASGAISFTPLDASTAMRVGAAGEETASSWNGWIDEFRLSVGVARWTAAFTVPDEPYDDNRSFLLGIPAPAQPSLVVVGGVATAVSRSYLTTWVSAYGEEGPASTPIVVTDNPDGSWDLTLTAADADDIGGPDRNLTHTRIYRTITASTGVTTYFLVAEIDIGTTTYSDILSDTVVSANNELLSTNWIAPPEDLEGFIAMPNGFLAGFRANEIWFSEPYRPHAWPAAYTIVVDFPVVGLGVTGQTLVACTRGYPVTVTGIHPASMSQAKSTSLEPCLSRGSILSTAEGVFYSSPNGLIFAGQGSITNITRQLITKDKWTALTTAASLRAARLGTAYYAFGSRQEGVFDPLSFDPLSFTQEDFRGGYSGILIDPMDQRVAFNLLSDPVPITSVQNDPWSGEIFIIKNDALYRIDLGELNPTRRVYLWRTKIFQSGRPTNMGVMKIYWEAQETTPTVLPAAPIIDGLIAEFPALPGGSTYGVVRAYADGNLVWTRNLVTSGELMRLPTGFKATYWQFEFETYVDIFSVQVASTAKELSKI